MKMIFNWDQNKYKEASSCTSPLSYSYMRVVAAAGAVAMLAFFLSFFLLFCQWQLSYLPPHGKRGGEGIHKLAWRAGSTPFRAFSAANTICGGPKLDSLEVSKCHVR